MLLKLLLKLWPSLIPIALYILWILIKRMRRKARTEYEIIAEKSETKEVQKNKKQSDFSLENKHFVVVLYLTLIFGILAIVTMAIGNSGRQNYDVKKLELPRE